jgi:hypothetical protein
VTGGTGSTSPSITENGTDRGTPFSLPRYVSTNYAVTESGNYIDGSLNLSESGADRYSLLEQFTNTSNAGTGNGPGNVDYSPTGAPFVMGQPPASPTAGGAYPGGQSPTAAEQDPFAQQGLDLLHEYCFAAGTRVLTKSGSRPIEQIESGELVLSVDDRNPHGPAEWKAVEQIYHNAPAALLNVHVRASNLPWFASGDWRGGLGKSGAAKTTKAFERRADTVLRTTFNHPFYVLGEGWIAAGELRIGDRLRAADGQAATVTALFANGDAERVFNLRVADSHTYFAGAFEGPCVLVHNTSPAETRQKIQSVIGDWTQKSEFSVADVNKLVRAGLATQSITGDSYSVNVRQVTNIAIPQDDGSVDTLTLGRREPWFSKPYNVTDRYERGTTPAEAEAAQECAQAAGSDSYMTIHDGLQMVEGGLLAAPAMGPIGAALAADYFFTGGRQMATGKRQETMTTEIVAAQLEEVGRLDRATAVQIGRGVHLGGMMFGDAALGTLPVEPAYLPRVGYEPPAGFLAENGTPTVARTNAQLVQDIAIRAETKVGGTGRLAGIDKHTYAKNLLDRYQRMFGDRGLLTEVSVMAGKGVPYGTVGSVRLDVVEGSIANPTAIFDYKFGAAGLLPGRVNRIRTVTGYGPNTPIFEVRP